MRSETVDERDTNIEWDVRSFRLIDWREFDPTTGDRNGSLAIDVLDCSLDEFLAFARRPREIPARLTELFAVFDLGEAGRGRVLLGVLDWNEDRLLAPAALEQRQGRATAGGVSRLELADFSGQDDESTA